jgi:hypothetical protein
MAVVSFRIGEGARTTTRTVQSVVASGLVRVNTALVTPTIGDTVEIFTGGLSGNIGFYTIYGLSGTLGYYLRPFPNLQAGAGGSIARLNRTGSIPTSGTAISGVQALSGLGNLAVVWVPGALLRSSNVNRNDRAVISGSSISGNWGAWFVQDVISEDMVVLRPPDRGAGLATEFPGTGSIVFRQGIHVMKAEVVSGETLGWSLFATSGILPVSGASLFQGSGELRDYVRKRRIHGTGFERDFFLIEGIGTPISFVVSGISGLIWRSEDEIVISARPEPTLNGGTTGGDANFPQFGVLSGTPGTPIDMRLGGQGDFSDRYSVTSGSIWEGIRFPALAAGQSVYKGSYYGSWVSPPSQSQPAISPNASGIASIFRGTLSLTSGAMSESCIVYGLSLNPTGDADTENILVGVTSSTANISDAGTVIGGLLVSEGTATPIAATIFTSGPPAVVLDPRIDLDISVYFQIFFAGGSMEKRYTFNPRFVSSDAPAASASPIEGLYVELFEVVEGSGAEAMVFSGVTDADGYLNAGAGQQLRRQSMTSTGTTQYSHRMTVQGGGFRLENRLFTLATRVDADITVQRIAPDYESEFDE